MKKGQEILFDEEHTPILHRWQSAVSNHYEQNRSILEDIVGNTIFYPKNSQIRDLKTKIAEQKFKLGEVFEYEYEDYIELYPNRKIVSLESQQEKLEFPYKGFAAGAFFSAYTVLFKRHPSVPFKKLPFWKGVIITNTCCLFDFLVRNNDVSGDIEQLRFLKWCLAYRINTCLLEFKREEEKFGPRYRTLKHLSLNAYSPVDHYSDMLKMGVEYLTLREIEEEPILDVHGNKFKKKRYSMKKKKIRGDVGEDGVEDLG